MRNLIAITSFITLLLINSPLYACMRSPYASSSPLMGSPLAAPKLAEHKFATPLTPLDDQSENLFFAAVEDGNLERVRNLLNDPKTKDCVNATIPIRSIPYCPRGQTPLIRATIKGNLRMVKLLVAAGACPETIDEQEKNALTYSVELDKTEIFSHLMVYTRVSPHRSDSLLVKAIQNRNKEMAQLLLGMGVDPRISQIHTGITALKAAEENGADFADIAKRINEKIEEAHKKSERKRLAKALKTQTTPLLHEFPENVKQPLLSCLAHTNPAKMAQVFFRHALTDPEFLAIMNDSKKLKTFFKTMRNKRGRIALAKYFKCEMAGGKIPFIPDFTSAQIIACQDTFKPIFARNTPMSTWLKKTQDHMQACPPLHTQEEVQKALENRYIDLEEETMRRVLLKDIQAGRIDKVSRVLQAGIDPDIVFCPSTSYNIQELNILLNHCSKAMIELLLDAGANSLYILPFAINNKNQEITILLLQKGANDLGTGITPLMQAARAGDKEIVTFLLFYVKVDPATVNPRDGKTAADYARQYGHEHIALLLSKFK